MTVCWGQAACRGWLNTGAQRPRAHHSVWDTADPELPKELVEDSSTFPFTQTCFPHLSQVLFQRALPTLQKSRTKPDIQICASEHLPRRAQTKASGYLELGVILGKATGAHSSAVWLARRLPRGNRRSPDDPTQAVAGHLPKARLDMIHRRDLDQHPWEEEYSSRCSCTGTPEVLVK